MDDSEQFTEFELIYGLVPLENIFGAEIAAKIEKRIKNGKAPGVRLLSNVEGARWIRNKTATTCLQSGLCCFRYEVDKVPGYAESKPICHDCRHLRKAALQQEVWTLAACTIYRARPAVCGEYHGPISALVYKIKQEDGSEIEQAPCAEGLGYWYRLFKNYGGNPPPEISHFFSRIRLI